MKELKEDKKERIEELKKIGYNAGLKVGANNKITNRITYLIDNMDHIEFNDLVYELKNLLSIDIELNENKEVYTLLCAYVGGKNNAVQNKANKKWQDKNKDHANYLKSRSSARGFIKNKSTLEDLEELKQMIKDREEYLKGDL